jgi:hypothetical protein
VQTVDITEQAQGVYLEPQVPGRSDTLTARRQATQAAPARRRPPGTRP